MAPVRRGARAAARRRSTPQLTHDDGLTHFDYFTLAMLSEAPDRTLRMTHPGRADQRHAGAPVERDPPARGPRSRRADALPGRPPGDGRRAHRGGSRPRWWPAAPGHVDQVRRLVVDALTPQQLQQLGVIAEQLLGRLDPDHRMVDLGQPSIAGGVVRASRPASTATIRAAAGRSPGRPLTPRRAARTASSAGCGSRSPARRRYRASSPGPAVRSAARSLKAATPAIDWASQDSRKITPITRPSEFENSASRHPRGARPGG